MPKIVSLLENAPLILDGAWGTELQQLGLAPGACPDLWNITHPERVERVARSYIEAGSQVILTNTFGANRLVLSRHGLDERVAEINRAGVAISLRAATPGTAVVASVGPTGKLLAMGDITPAELRDVYGEQLRAIADGGVEAVVLETFTDLEELGIALEAAKQVGLFTIACMVFDSGAKKDRTAMGVNPEQAVARLTSGGADAIGANCGRGVEAYAAICERLRAATQLPLWLKPNAGLPELVEGQTRYATTADQFAAGTLGLLARGANLVGGCCGTSPAFVRAIVAARHALA